MHRKVDSYLLHGLGRLALAIAWNAIVFPSAYFVYRGQQPLVIKIILGLFVILGPLLLWGGIRSTILGMRYRQSIVTLDRHPVHAGESLTGRFSWPRYPPGDLRIALECLYRAGKRRDVLWRDEREIPALSLQHGEMETSLPFAFHLPPELPPSGRVSSSAEHVWILSAAIGPKGAAEFVSTFPITVQSTPKS